MKRVRASRCAGQRGTRSGHVGGATLWIFAIQNPEYLPPSAKGKRPQPFTQQTASSLLPQDPIAGTDHSNHIKLGGVDATPPFLARGGQSTSER